MVPTTTDADPQIPTQVPVPGSTHEDSGASRTASSHGPTLSPAQIPQDPHPKESYGPIAKDPDPKPTNIAVQHPPDPPSIVVSGPQASSTAPVGDPSVEAGPDDPKPQGPTQTHAQDGSAQDLAHGANPVDSSQPEPTSIALPDFDPSNVSPNQMSEIEDALAPSPAAAPPTQHQSQGLAPAVGSPGQPQTQGGVLAAPLVQTQGLDAIVASAVDAEPIPLGSSAVVVDGASSVDLGPVIKSVGNQAITAELTVVESAQHTLAAGAPGVTIGGTAMSLGTAGKLVENSQTMAVQGPSVGLGGLTMGGFVPVVTNLGGQTVTAIPTAVSIAGSALTPGAPGATIGGIVVALNTAGDLVVGSKTAALEGLGDMMGRVATLANGAVITAGGSPATVGKTVVAILSDESGFVVNGQTISVPTTASAPIFTVAGQAFTAAQSGFAIGSQTLSAGGPAATISGTVVSLGSSVLQIGTSTIPLPTAAPASIFSIAGQAFTAAQSGFAIGSQTLSPGGLALTISGTVVSLGSSALQIGTSIIPLPTAAPTSVFSVAGQVFTAAPGGFAIGSQTLSPGGSAVTVSGTVVSLGSAGLQIGSSTIPLPTAAPGSALTVGGQAFTAAQSGFAIGSQSLTPGGSAITISGTVVSLGPSGLQVGSSTLSLQGSGGVAGATLSSFSLGAATSVHSTGMSTSPKSSKAIIIGIGRIEMWRRIGISMAVILALMNI